MPPKQYEDIRDSYERKGVPMKRAKKLAAMTYNAHRKPGVAPVTNHSGEPVQRKPVKALGDAMAEK